VHCIRLVGVVTDQARRVYCIRLVGVVTDQAGQVYCSRQVGVCFVLSFPEVHHAHTYTNIYIDRDLTHIRTKTYTHIYSFTHIYIHTQIDIYIHTHIYIFIHTRTYTQRLKHFIYFFKEHTLIYVRNQQRSHLSFCNPS